MVSPRAEMKIKVRQISQGVGELNWTKQQSDEEMIEEVPQTQGEGLLEAAPVLEKTEPIAVDVQETQPAEEIPVTTADSTLGPDSGAEKGLKRKFLERGTSTGPPDDAPKEQEPTQKEEKDASPTPDPKPTERTSPPSPKVPKLVRAVTISVLTKCS